MQLTIQPNYYLKTANFKKSNYASSQIKIHNTQADAVSFKGEGNDRKFDWKAHYNENLQHAKGWRKGVKAKNAKTTTDAQALGFYEAQAETDSLRDINQGLMEQMLNDKNNELGDIKQQIIDLKKDLTDAQAAKKENEELLAKIKDLQDQFNKKQTEYDAKTRQANDMNTIYENATKREAETGWERIAGNEVIKEKLNESFIRKLAAEKAGVDVKMPNGILFYGPQSTGKTLFAKAFAQQAALTGSGSNDGCNYVEIDMIQSDDDIMNDLLKAAKQSKKDYADSGQAKKRTIILLDEFDSIASSNEKDLGKVLEDTKIGKLKNFLQKCSDEYKCTVFMTTNHPLRLSSELLADQRIPVKVFLGPPEKEDAEEIFKFYLKGDTDQVIDHAKLADEVMKARETNQAFSVGRIKTIVSDYIAITKKAGQKATENGLIQAIREAGSDIIPESMDKFAKEIAAMTKRAL